MTRPLLTLLLLLALLALPALAQTGPDSPGAAPFAPPVDLQLPAPAAPSPSPAAGLDQRLSALVGLQDHAPGAAAAAADLDLRIEEGLVQIQLTALDPLAAAQAVRAAGGRVTAVSRFSNDLQGWLPPAALPALAADPSVNAVFPPQYAEPVDIAAGAITSEGVAAMNAPAWHAAGYDGTGIKIAIIDVGFAGYSPLLGSDLPQSVTLKNFVDGQSDGQAATGSEHGTAVAEIIHDIAPGAQLYLIKINTNLDLQEAVAYAAAQGADIISTSLIWYNATPGDGTGQFADLVQSARDQGILWVTAAGNDRERHWGGTLRDVDNDGWHEFAEGQEANYFTAILNPNTGVRVYLRWNDWPSADQDLDLYLHRYDEQAQPPWVQVASSTNRQDGGQRPVEALAYTTTGEAAIYAVAVYAANVSRSVDFDLFAARLPRLEENTTARSLGNLADAPAAITTAAIDFTAPYAQHNYSAEGPTNGAGGSAGAAGAYAKPDIAAYARVGTTIYNSFGGTSAAAPHVAGAAALVLQANPAFTPSQLSGFLLTGAQGLGAPSIFGSGRLYLPGEFATATPTASPTVTTTATPTVTATTSPTVTPTGTATALPSATPAITASPTVSAGATIDPDSTPAATAQPPATFYYFYLPSVTAATR